MALTEAEALVLELVESAGNHGATWKEIDKVTGYGHGTISGALSGIHRQGLVFYIKTTRDNNCIYVSRSLRHEFPNKDCVDKPSINKSTRILIKIIDAYENYEDLSPLIKEARAHVYK